MPSKFSVASIEKSYLNHPIRMDNILRRLPPEKLRRGKIKESDLAFDPDGFLTDQNHIGGAEFVLEIAKRMEVSKKTKILELGSGIGGAARLLAAEYKCHVTGIDISTARIDDSRKLSDLCGLSSKNQFIKANFNNPPRELANQFDLIFSQNSLVHSPRIDRVLKGWSSVLKLGGRIAIEDVFLRKAPSKKDAKHLAHLLEIWNSYVNPLGKWDLALLGAGCEFSSFENLTGAMKEHFETLREFSRQHGTEAEEHESYALALRLIESGTIGYFRAVSGPVTRI